ncbi:hypothetical protein [Pseudomonas nicosulfuronedens]
MNKILLLFLLPLTLAACCPSSDLKYNEVVTSAFLQNVHRIDRDMERLINGDFEPGHAEALKMHAQSPAAHLGELEQSLNQVQQLPHSEEAGKFASSLSRYYELQINYYQQLKRYVESQDKAGKEALAQNLNNTYQALRPLPEQILAVQKQFLERSGLPH